MAANQSRIPAPGGGENICPVCRGTGKVRAVPDPSSPDAGDNNNPAARLLFGAPEQIDHKQLLDQLKGRLTPDEQELLQQNIDDVRQRLDEGPTGGTLQGADGLAPMVYDLDPDPGDVPEDEFRRLHDLQDKLFKIQEEMKGKGGGKGKVRDKAPAPSAVPTS